ncbi:MAG: 30S ribosomal protein S13 [Candidatus Omnitrophica bacterium]|nr:30S ribosomal protein S13 [Candidatus Omnitrophota bacterium]
MPRIVGVEVPKEKQIQVALTYLFGIGRSSSRRVLTITQVDPTKRAKDLTDEEVSKLSQAIQANYKVEGDLRREVSANIKRLIDIGSYRGTRHKKGLPVRGQRSRTNARSRKGPRPRVGVRKRAKVLAGTGRPGGA